jgi:rod shape-determining protein MreD
VVQTVRTIRDEPGSAPAAAYTRPGGADACGRDLSALVEGSVAWPGTVAMNLPLAAIGAFLAALVETSVLPELRIDQAQPDLVLVLAVVWAMNIGADDGLVVAFVGGLMLDLLTPERPLGATTLSLLVVTGIAALVARLLSASRWLAAIAATFALSWVYHALLIGIMAVTAGVAILGSPVQGLLLVALLDLALAAAVTLLARPLLRLFGPAEREW